MSAASIPHARKVWNAFAWVLYAFDFVLVWIAFPSLLARLGFRVWFFSRAGSRIGLSVFGIRVEIQGLENVRSLSGVAFVANHRSWFDQLAMCSALPHPLCFLANVKYFRYPFLGRAMRLYGHVPVDPARTPRIDDRSREALVETLQAGGNLAVFPEGTRNTDAALLPFERGIFRIAARAGAPVVPLWILGSGEVYPRQAPLLSVRSGVIRIVVGKPSWAQEGDWEAHARDVETEFRRVYARETGGGK
jgi:1-acyl-sn-glycerol-3-phosphate acyltransferase